jgi:hypothetical protein
VEQVVLKIQEALKKRGGRGVTTFAKNFK